MSTRRRSVRSARRRLVDEASNTDESSSPKEEQSLYTEIHKNPSSLTDIVDAFIKSYKKDREKAFLTLAQYFIDASGCNGRLTPEMLSTVSYAAIVLQMREECDEDVVDYPLIKTGKNWTRFQDNFSGFLQLLVKGCQHEIIYDQYLLKEAMSLLACFSESHVRAFRHTSTIAALKLMTALVKVIRGLCKSANNLKRQFDAESRKNLEMRSIDRKERLESQRDELGKNLEELDYIFECNFKSVFVIRINDVMPQIRSACVHELGLWITKIPDTFLNDSYLKYLGWLLHDPAAKVRLESIKALKPLYEFEEFAPKLQLFTLKFKNRIVAMRLDEVAEVGAEAIGLATQMQKFHAGAFGDVDCENIYELIYARHKSVRHAARDFLNERHFLLDETERVERTKTGKRRSPHTPLIRDLVSFFIDSEQYELGEYLVDSLLGSNPMMKDWECMTDLLLEEPGSGEEPLDAQKEASLIELMTHCVNQATGGRPAQRGPKVLSAKERKLCDAEMQKITEHFAKCLPQLLQKYRVDPKNLVHLLSLPRHFRLEMYTEMRWHTELRDLLESIRAIVENSYDPEVLNAAAEILAKICSDGGPVDSYGRQILSSLLEDIVNQFKEFYDDFCLIHERDSIPNDEDNFRFIGSLRKMVIFYRHHDLSEFDPWDSLHRIINVKFPVDAVVYSIEGCSFAILWANKRIKSNCPENSSLSIDIDDEIRELHDRLDLFLNLMRHFIAGTETSVALALRIREEAFIAICDFLIVFSEPSSSSENPVANELVYEADKSVQTILNRFLQDRVFPENREQDNRQDDESLENKRLNRNRVFLAAYCKLLMVNVIPVDTAADILKHYARRYDDYGDLIHTLIISTRNRDGTSKWALTLLDSLGILWNEKIDPEKSVLDQNYEEFLGISALAKKFAKFFGRPTEKKNREAIVAFHRSAIEFALETVENAELNAPPPKLQFLEIIALFSIKLIRQDKLLVLKHLDKKLVGRPSPSESEGWESLLLYRKSLEHNESGRAPARWAFAKNHVGAIGEEEDNAPPDEEPHRDVTKQKKKTKKKKKGVSKKNPLPVSTISYPRQQRSESRDNLMEIALTPESPQPMIEDLSPSPMNIDEGLKSMEIRSPRLYQDTQ